MKDPEWVDLLASIQVDRQVAADFVAMRKAKKAPISQTALKMIQAESVKAGMTMQDALSECVLRGWTGFKADWVKVQPQQARLPMNAREEGRRAAGISIFGNVEEQYGHVIDVTPTTTGALGCKDFS